MSWLTNVFGPLLRTIGIGRPKDRAILSPLSGSDLMRIMGDGSDRATEAIAAIKGFVRPPYQITDRELHIEAVSWEEGKTYFREYGYRADNWKGSREGNFYAPKPPVLLTGTIHLVDKKLDQNRRCFLALHEYAHSVWHWLLTVAEWDTWNMRNWTYEQFADDFARRMLGDKLDKHKTKFFEDLERRLTQNGSKSQRL